MKSRGVAGFFLTICSCQLVWGLFFFLFRQRKKVLLHAIVFFGRANRHFLEAHIEIIQNICSESSVPAAACVRLSVLENGRLLRMRMGNVAGWEEQASKQRGGDAKS